MAYIRIQVNTVQHNCLTSEGPNEKFNPPGGRWRFKRHFVSWIPNRMIVNFSPVYHDPRPKLIHVRFRNSQKPLVVVSNNSWLIFEKNFDL